jgi:hypothetical protein
LLHAINCFADILAAHASISESKTFQGGLRNQKRKEKGRLKADLFPN